MRAVGRNIRRARVTCILGMGLSGEVPLEEGLWWLLLGGLPVRVLLESFGKLRSRFGGCGREELGSLKHPPPQGQPQACTAAQHDSATEISPPGRRCL